MAVKKILRFVVKSSAAFAAVKALVPEHHEKPVRGVVAQERLRSQVGFLAFAGRAMLVKDKAL